MIVDIDFKNWVTQQFQKNTKTKAERGFSKGFSASAYKLLYSAELTSFFKFLSSSILRYHNVSSDSIYVSGTPEQARPARPRSGLDFQIHNVEAT